MTNPIYAEIEAADKAGDLGNSYLVTPATGKVELDLSFEADLATDAVYMSADGTIDWPEGMDYTHSFEPAENLYARNWEWHLEDYVSDGKPFYIQTQVIAYDDAEPDTDALVGWALLVKVIES